MVYLFLGVWVFFGISGPKLLEKSPEGNYCGNGFTYFWSQGRTGGIFL